MRKVRLWLILVLLAALSFATTACCHPCCQDWKRWWEPCGTDCAPCGDPCNACDSRG